MVSSSSFQLCRPYSAKERPPGEVVQLLLGGLTSLHPYPNPLSKARVAGK